MSETVRVGGARPYSVHAGAGVAADVVRSLGAYDRVAVVADRAVWALHGPAFGALETHPRLELEGGEGAKSLDVLGEVLGFLAGAHCSRRSCVVTVGGGTMGDLGGLAASLFKRGVDVVHVATTLLSQVDASVGGKTAINLAAGKNLAGTFHHPAGVFADTALLATLPATEWRSGLGEVLKTAIIGGEATLARLEEHAERMREPAVLAPLVADLVTVKARVVEADPDERDARRALNLGHTFAHAIEHAAGYGAVAHGVAVAAGIGIALSASEGAGLLEDLGLPSRVSAIAAKLGLPRGLSDLQAELASPLAVDALVAGLAHDKKGAVGAPEFVLVRGVGDLALGEPLDPDLVRRLCSTP